jgi:membrane protein implicated in regulation of membrane protease activity
MKESAKGNMAYALALWLALVVVFLLLLPQLFKRRRARSGQRIE